ncbi:hypothetical protein Vadar_009995 [Vaccinium darrowii]|uniref:Uncharacterized protein n=1 Tax=Vaccinium darrowii TaxID=229202 RepID=A0ACB7ZBI2_9ERIC|nr:hypothetical protein Vadar_009995 [Vaccinium darrowii]
MKIKYCRTTEQYYVAEFAPVHNHTVSTPSKTHLHRSHRKFGVAQAAQADLANDSGIAPRAVVEFMARQHAASTYTPDVFVLVQRELSKAHDCKLEKSGENGTITKYEITPYGKYRYHVVTYDSSEDTVTCSCKKFEFGGILCSHALKVLSSNNVVRIPDQYILKRWTKNAKSRSIEATCASSPVEDPKAMMGIQYKELCRLCTQMVTRAVETEEAYKIALNALQKISEDVDASLTGQTFHETSHANMSASQEINEATYGEETEKRVKGLKVKERTTRSSKRSRGALQRAVRSKRAYSMNIVPVQESEMHQPSCFSQAPLSQAIDEEFLFNSFEYESQRKSNDVEDQDGDTFFQVRVVKRVAIDGFV